ncbi:hypothetical protein EK21DRAFT_107010 [Setomelanomma holmii]|uniref:GPI anchored cell wall protein n=1 Tax=Setomelanomma holmii TaxID=210430 RepID=A0A9P4HJ28_9PLEO|nr:hypothetical protein EK21DRAFT_107010 [Setomelanomma holmii]
MLGRTLFAATFFALASFTVATPPGCLLGAVNSYDDPADVKSVCNSKDSSKTIAKFCGDSTKDALAAFADICNGAGVKFSTDVSKSSSSATATVSATASGSKASATVSGSMVIQPSGNSTVPTSVRPSSTGAAGGASGTSTGGISQSTGAARKLEIGLAAAFAGLLAVAL